MTKSPNLKTKGFTLIELMIAVAIVGILFTIALPSYRNYILRTHHVDARNMLQAAAQKLEQNFSANRRYDQDSDGNPITDATLETWGFNRSPSDGSARYEISFSANPTSSTFTLQAIPTDAQSGDECGTLTLNQSNVRTAGGGSARSELSRRCWTR